MGLADLGTAKLQQCPRNANKPLDECNSFSLSVTTFPTYAARIGDGLRDLPVLCSLREQALKCLRQGNTCLGSIKWLRRTSGWPTLWLLPAPARRQRSCFILECKRSTASRSASHEATTLSVTGARACGRAPRLPHGCWSSSQGCCSAFACRTATRRCRAGQQQLPR